MLGMRRGISSRLVVKLTSLAVVLISGTELLGWVFQVPVLNHIFPELPTMKVNTALCLVLAGVLLWQEQREKGRAGPGEQTGTYQRLAQAVAGCIILVGLLTLVEFSFNVNLGIDQILLQQPEPAGSKAFPGRMGPNVALAFSLIGSALLLLKVNRPNYRAAQILTLGAWLIGFIGLTGHVFGGVSFYTAGSYTGMAWHTAIAFLLLSSGTLYTQPDRGWMPLLTGKGAGSQMIRRLLPLTIVLPILLGGLSQEEYYHHLYSEEVEDALSTTLNVLAFSTLVSWNAYKLNRLDSQRQQAETRLQQANATLEQQVEERTYQLRESEERLSLAIYGAGMGTWDVVVSTGRALWSAQHFRLLGYEPVSNGAATSDMWQSRVYPDDLEDVMQAIQQSKQLRSLYCPEHRIIRVDNGQVTWLAPFGQFLYNEAGEAIRFIGVVFDITARKQAEADLRQSEERLRQILQNMPVMLDAFDEHWNIIVWNQECERVTGFSADEVLQNSTILEQFYPDVAYREQMLVAWAEQGNHYRNWEWDITCKAGGTRTVSWSNLSDQFPVAGWASWGIGVDVTDRKRAEAELTRLNQELEQRVIERTLELQQQTRILQITLDTIGEGIIVADKNGKFLLFNSAAARLDGVGVIDLPPDRWSETYQFFLPDRVTPFPATDLPLVRAIQGEVVDDIEVFCQNSKIRQGGAWVRCSGRPLRDEQGQVWAGVVVFHDITERKLSEQALRESEAQHRRIVETANEGIWEIDINNRTTFVNPAMAKMLGYRVEEMLDQPLFAFMDEEGRAIAAANFNHRYQSHIEQHDFKLQRQDGSDLWAILSTTPITNNLGQTIGALAMVTDISDRKQIEAALRQSEERLQLALEGSGDGLWDWNITTGELYLSPRWLEMLGYQPGELLGHVSTWEWLIHPDDQPGVTEILHAHLQDSAVPYKFDYQVRTKTGEWKWIANYGKVTQYDENNAPVRMTGTHRDNSDRKHAEAILQEQDRRWRSLLDNVQLVVVGLDQTGNVEYVNPFFLKLTGYTEAEVLNQSWFNQFLPTYSRSLNQSTFQEVLEHSFHAYYQNSILTKSGEERMIAWNNTLLRDVQDRPIGTISIGEDITDRHKLERMKAEFISVVSHELRTPLTSISGALELLATGLLQPQSDRGQQTIQIAYTEVDRLTRLVNDILDLERLESGKVRLEMHRCNLEDLLIRAVDFMQFAADQAGITLSVTPLSVWLEADGDRILQVLTNLLSNAIKFSPVGSTIWLSAEISSQERRIDQEINLGETSSPLVLVTVCDQGRGIPADKLEAIFERFHQVDASDSRQKGGTGLGLAICRNIVQQHGGDIWAESTLGEGSRFYFTLQT